jgi:hypothetical protein
MVVGAGAAGVAAISSSYTGSDTLLNVTISALTNAGITNGKFIGGGTVNGIALQIGTTAPFLAANALQQSTPATRLPKSSDVNLCAFNNNAPGGTGGNAGADGGGLTSASSVVIGLDAVDVFSSTSAGGATTLPGGAAGCNGTADNQSGTGLAQTATSGVFTGTSISPSNQNWKWVLALLYGGYDYSQPKGGPKSFPDCSQASRVALVANWNNLFQSCSNGNAACAATGPTGGALWHAFRRDDDAGTADVFSNILGLSPSVSNNSLNGFGASPFCNAVNWDVTTANVNCGAGIHLQFTGPGGVADTTSDATGAHREPPPGTWGVNPNGSGTTKVAWDVLPTTQQDNDPIRRPCLGTGIVSNPLQVGEEVCNLDGQLGVVLPVVTTDFIPKQLSLLQYPTAVCKAGFVVGTPPSLFKCAPNGTVHTGECPNGDTLFSSGCLLPTATGTSQCINKEGNVPSLFAWSAGQCSTIGQTQCVTQAGFPVASSLSPGLFYNATMRDGTVTDGTVAFIQYPIPAINSSVDFLGAYNRIHQLETVLGSSGGVALGSGCQFQDADDQIACLLQADPCSVGFAADGAKSFTASASATPSGNLATLTAANGPLGSIDSVRVAEVYPTPTTVHLLGQAGEYQYARKLYFSTLVGFNNIAATGPSADPQATDELALAEFESVPGGATPSASSIVGILTSNKFFSLGNQFLGDAAGAPDPQFCEDLNEQTICNDVATGTNVNGCVANSTIPASTSFSGVPITAGGVPGGAAGTVAQTGTPGVFETAGTSTICGDGIRGPYEECDNGSVANPVAGHSKGNGSDVTAGGCSLTCRCNNAFVNGACN